jgi:hypothetical protein
MKRSLILDVHVAPLDSVAIGIEGKTTTYNFERPKANNGRPPRS